MLPFFYFFLIKFVFIIRKEKSLGGSLVFIVPNVCAGLSLNGGFPAFDSEVQDAIVSFMGYH